AAPEAARAGTAAEAAASAASQATRPPPPIRGLWVLAEGGVRVLDDPARIEPLLARAARLGVTDLFVQVYRGGRAFYPADPAVERAPSATGAGGDALALLLEA